MLLLLLLWLPALSADEDIVNATSCDLSTARRLTVIKSEGFPGPYEPRTACRYAIRRYSAEVCSVTFLFNVFDLRLSDGCHRDYLVLHGERLCGSKPTGFTRSIPFRRPDDEVVMTFVSDNGTETGLGFMATVVQQECPPPSCDQKFTGPSFTLRSPNFPAPYADRQLCDYTVLRSNPNVCRLRIEARTFDVQSSNRCEADSLEIRGNRLCGTLPPGEIVSVDFTEPTLVLRFRSDHAVTSQGFHLVALQEECVSPTTSTTTTPTTSSTSMPTMTTTDFSTTPLNSNISYSAMNDSATAR